MKVRCEHGYFTFEETRVGQVSDFMSLTDLDLVSIGPVYTFMDLFEAPDYSLQGKELLDVVATATFAGTPAQVFEANAIVYDFTSGFVVPIDSVTRQIRISQAGNKIVSSGLILPGSLTQSGERIRDFSGFYSRDTQRWLYSEVGYV